MRADVRFLIKEKCPAQSAIDYTAVAAGEKYHHGMQLTGYQDMPCPPEC